MTRTEFQELAEVRLKEADSLLTAGLWDGAYYLAGYAVECALKACIVKGVKAEDFPDKELANKFFTHDLRKLLVLAKLQDQFDADVLADPTIEPKWEVVVHWNEGVRYSRAIEGDARDMLAAVSDANSGVLTWIRRYW